METFPRKRECWTRKDVRRIWTRFRAQYPRVHAVRGAECTGVCSHLTQWTDYHSPYDRIGFCAGAVLLMLFELKPRQSGRPFGTIW